MTEKTKATIAASVELAEEIRVYRRRFQSAYPLPGDSEVLDLDAIRPLVQVALRAHLKRKKAGICDHREDGCVWCNVVPYRHWKAWQHWAEGGP